MLGFFWVAMKYSFPWVSLDLWAAGSEGKQFQELILKTPTLLR